MSQQSPQETPSPGAMRLLTVLVGLDAALIVLQGVWAGIFIREGKDNNDTWVEVHARAADLAILIALVAVVVVVVRLRSRRDLLFGSIGVAVLLMLEAFLGGLIGSTPAIETLHFPIALALVGLTVWLLLRSRRAT